ncbi:glycoside hydrolase family 9 protein [Persicitalea jodogahamensis]|uniref:Endoglucanase n=1 Tax=Persicitalea jodogahamensis TaxID=402147 RepID=A0A8J3D3Q3_9BACT|nr:glycoside hydrolase family 9 protein [Persicitalea jodogahamensis]GHB67880.1 endoglucanase [Persicitalea jodogahamensis]
MKNFTQILLIFLLSFLTKTTLAQLSTDSVRLNQLGYYPDAPKTAAIYGAGKGGFILKTAEGNQTVYHGQLSENRTSPFSAKTTRIADFSAFTKPGRYVLEVPEIGASYPFEIKNQVHDAASRAAIKGYYFQRMSTPLPEKYAGKWARPGGHPDVSVLVHPSAASPLRPAGTTLSAPGGWYDAGDYNKYIVNSGISVGTMLAAYEDFPAYYDTLNLNIPESSNALPDLLDEVLYNLRWMLTMQDPNDGGVYHKLTNPVFDGMNVMPHEATKPRFVVQKSTAAALDFAAVMAQGSRIFKKYRQPLPGLADSCLIAAQRAWGWAKVNPNVVYDQDAINSSFDPDIKTGTYGDRNLADEFIWAACELYITTKSETYYKAVNLFPDEKMPLPSWPQVRLMGYYSLLRHAGEITDVARKDVAKLKVRMVAMADGLIEGTEKHYLNTVMGHSKSDYAWGSSSVAANQGMAIMQAYRLTQDRKYLNAALTNVDYLLGRNGTGYCFLTGFGSKRVMHPHHRPSVADGVTEPVPGLLSGGPNPGKQDKCPTYTSDLPDEAFTDDDCSYASNEICINWNAPLVYLLGAVEASTFSTRSN